MSRFHQRLRKRMENPAFAPGYREMSAELALLRSPGKEKTKRASISGSVAVAPVSPSAPGGGNCQLCEEC